MKIVASLLVVLLLHFGCIAQTNGWNKEESIFVDNFPSIKFDTTVVDTNGFKRLVRNALYKNNKSTDSFRFVVECTDNVVFENLITVGRIINNEMRKFPHLRNNISIYNKCMDNINFPPAGVNKKPDVIITVDSIGRTFMEGRTISIDAVIAQNKGQNILVEIIADRNLLLDKLIPIMDKLNTEKFAVIWANHNNEIMSTEKKQFFAKLNPPRTTFMQDMTSEERQAMGEHIAYWKQYVEDGTMMVYGPVMVPAGGYGIGILQVDDEATLQKLISHDPALKTGSRYEYYPMRAVTKTIG